MLVHCRSAAYLAARRAPLQSRRCPIISCNCYKSQSQHRPDHNQQQHAPLTAAAVVVQRYHHASLGHVRVFSSDNNKDNESDKKNVFEELKKAVKGEVDKNPDLKGRFTKVEAEAREQLSKAEKRYKEEAESMSEKVRQASETLNESFKDVTDNMKEKWQVKAEESDFVKASKEKFAGAKQELSQNTLLSKLAQSTQGVRKSVGDLFYELVGGKAEENKTIVKKLHKEKKKKKKKTDDETAAERTDAASAGAAGTAATAKEGVKDKKVTEEEGSDSASDDEEEDKSSAKHQALMIFQSAAERWAKIQNELKKTSVGQDVINIQKAVGGSSVGKAASKAKQAVGAKVEDVAEAWETSQHPIVYKASSAWDNVSAETDEGTVVKLLRRLDSGFDLQAWREDLQETFLPDFMNSFFKGDIESLKPWTGEAALKKLTNQIMLQRQEGLFRDPNVLDIEHVEFAAMNAGADKDNPVIALHFLCQEINCIKNSDGKIVAGKEDEIIAAIYQVNMQREHLEKENELRWKVVDIMLLTAQPYQ